MSFGLSNLNRFFLQYFYANLSYRFNHILLNYGFIFTILKKNVVFRIWKFRAKLILLFLRKSLCVLPDIFIAVHSGSLAFVGAKFLLDSSQMLN